MVSVGGFYGAELITGHLVHPDNRLCVLLGCYATTVIAMVFTAYLFLVTLPNVLLYQETAKVWILPEVDTPNDHQIRELLKKERQNNESL